MEAWAERLTATTAKVWWTEVLRANHYLIYLTNLTTLNALKYVKSEKSMELSVNPGHAYRVVVKARKLDFSEGGLYKTVQEATANIIADPLRVLDGGRTLKVDVERLSPTQASITWNDISGTDCYKVSVQDLSTNDVKTYKPTLRSLRLDRQLGHAYQVTVEAQEYDFSGGRIAFKTFANGTANINAEYQGVTVGVRTLKVDADRVSTTEATITWDAVQGATRYKVTLQETSTDEIRTFNESTTTLSVSDLQRGQSYSVEVRAQKMAYERLLGFHYKTIAWNTTEIPDRTTGLVGLLKGLSLRERPRELRVEVERPSRTKATLKWNTVRDATRYKITIKDTASLFGKWEHTCTGITFVVPNTLKPGRAYSVTVEAQRPFYDETYEKLVEATTKFHAVFTSEELDRLHQKAISYTRLNESSYVPIQWLYRNKPQSFFDKVYTQDDGIMKVYLKDNNGDPASIINGRIKGLFFATRLDWRTNSPPSRSPFGPRRLYMPAAEVFSDPRVRLYFADFYCNRKAHYATIVLTHRGSDTDKFCRENLIELNTTENAFIITCYGQVRTRRNLHVEVLYTEDINMAEWKGRGAYEETVFSTGTSTPGGLPKNSACTICNLDTSSPASQLGDMNSLLARLYGRSVLD